MLAARRDCAAHRVLPPRAPPLVPPATPRGSASFRRAPSRPRAGGTRAAFEAASVPAAARPRAARADLARPPFLFLRPFRAAAAAATATGRTGRLSRGGGPRRFHAPAAIGGAMPPYVASIDQGTSSSKFVVYDRNGVCVAHHQEEFDQLYPRAGWVEHDPDVILRSVYCCIDKTIEKLKARGINPAEIKGVGITNQRETTLVWDAVTGRPLHNAIVWCDTRTAHLVRVLSNRTPSKSSSHWMHRCGLPITTYFSGVKLRWLLDNVPKVAEAAKMGNLRFGTVDSWLIYNMTGGSTGGGIHVTDVTNASRTMLMNLKTLKWDEELLSFFGVPRTCLPDIRCSSEIYAKVADGPLAGIPLSGCLGDQQAALVGQKCFARGEAKNTYGTGCFMLFNTGDKPVFSTHGLLTTVGYQMGKDAKPTYALEGSIAVAGSAVRWLRDNLGMIKDSAEIGELAAKVKDTAGVYFVPAFSGLFAPHWRDDARGTVVGLTQFSNKYHIARATLEAVCYQTREIVECMNFDSQLPLTSLKVDGGMTNSDTGMQIQADVIGFNVERPRYRETTALGAAIAAGLADGVGVWPSIDDLLKALSPASSGAADVDVFKPSIADEAREAGFRSWKRAVERSLGWAEDNGD